MARFDRVLRRAEERLDLPEPARSRVLLEVAADLEDLYRTYREEDLGEAEAARRAEEALGLSAESIDALSRLHAPLYRRLVERFSSSGRHRWERVVLVLLAATVAGGGAALAGGGFLTDSSPLIWPVIAVASWGLWIAAREFFRLAVRREHRRPDLARGLRLLPILSAASVLLGALGAGLELHDLAVSMARAAGGSAAILVPAVGRAAEVMTLSLITPAVLVPITFHLYRRVRRVERARAEWERRSTSDG